jgi:hypothetical protein
MVELQEAVFFFRFNFMAQINGLVDLLNTLYFCLLMTTQSQLTIQLSLALKIVYIIQ